MLISGRFGKLKFELVDFHAMIVRSRAFEQFNCVTAACACEIISIKIFTLEHSTIAFNFGMCVALCAGSVLSAFVRIKSCEPYKLIYATHIMRIHTERHCQCCVCVSSEY